MTTESPTINQPALENRSINLRSLAYQMERLATLEERITGNPPDREFLKYAKITAAGIFRVVVMGEIKKGKSSFINALTGTENLVPVHSDVATSTVFKIHYGSEVKYTVYFEETTGKEKLVIQPAEIDQYGTEAGNPDNEKRVEYIRVESPAPLLKTGLVIVDTPGIGGLFKKHREITWRHAPDADAIFFITESDGAPIGAEEVIFLKELKNITPLITFVQTKSSKAVPEARKARMENNLSILRKELQIPDAEITYFIVDSKLKVLADARKQSTLLEQSGFPAFMSYLNDSLRKKQKFNVAQSAIRRILARVDPLAQTLGTRKQVLDADTTKQRESLDEEISKLQIRLAEWDKNDKPRIVEAFRKGLTSLTREAQEELKPLQPSGPIQSRFDLEIENAANLDQVKLLMTQVQSDLAALTSSACIKIGEKAKNGVTILLESLMKDVVGTLQHSHELRLATIDPNKLWVNTGAIDRIVNRPIDNTLFTTGRNAFGGIAVGAGAAHFAGIVLGSLIAPGLGTVVGGFIGASIAGAWGGLMAIDSANDQKLEAYKRECYGALAQALGSAYQSATSQVNILISDMQAEASSLLQKMLQQANDNLLKTRSDLNQRQKATLEEVRKGKKEVDEQIQELQTIQKSLNAIQAEVAV